MPDTPTPVPATSLAVRQRTGVRGSGQGEAQAPSCLSMETYNKAGERYPLVNIFVDGFWGRKIMECSQLLIFYFFEGGKGCYFFFFLFTVVKSA